MEYVQVACPHCAKALRVPSSAGGRTAVCPHCSQRFTVPGGEPTAAAATSGPSVIPPSPPAPSPSPYQPFSPAPTPPPPLSPPPPPPTQAAAAPGYQLFTCPSCRGHMQVSSAQVGQTVACPHCGLQFVPNAAGSLPRPPAPGGTYGVGYGYQPAGGYRQPATNAPGAVAALVCGILSLFVCGIILGIVSLVQGNKAKSAIRANPQMYSGNGMATVGMVLGIIGLVLHIFLFMIMRGL